MDGCKKVFLVFLLCISIIDCRHHKDSMQCIKTNLDNYNLSVIPTSIQFKATSESTVRISNLHLENITSEFLLRPNSNLNYLDLSSNQVHSIEPHAFSNIKCLEFLFLEHNLLETVEIKTFNDQPTLRVLNLAHNHLHTITGFSFTKLTNLEVLHLNHNNLSVLSKYTFEGLHHLVYLDLSYNSIVLDVDTFKFVPHLEILNLTHNFLRSIPDFSFRGLEHLKTLKLENNLIEFLNVDILQDLNDLNTLNISNNHLSTIIGLESISLHSLNYLYLDRNRFTKVNMVKVVHTFPKLRMVRLDHNPWECRALHEIKDALDQKPSIVYRRKIDCTDSSEDSIYAYIGNVKLLIMLIVILNMFILGVVFVKPDIDRFWNPYVIRRYWTRRGNNLSGDNNAYEML